MYTEENKKRSVESNNNTAHTTAERWTDLKHMPPMTVRNMHRMRQIECDVKGIPMKLSVAIPELNRQKGDTRTQTNG